MSQESITSSYQGEEWWNVIQAMAEYIAYGFNEEDLEEGFLRVSLQKRGFSESAIEEALDWLDTASLSSNVSEVFSMLQPSSNPIRIASPVEQVCISEKLWLQLEKLRLRGIISPDLIEKLLEGVRMIDTRDWEDEEVKKLVFDIMFAVLPNTAKNVIEEMLAGNSREFYS